MSSSIGRIYDDYDTYLWLCEQLEITPVEIRDGFYDHAKSLIANFSKEQEKKFKGTYAVNTLS